MLIAASIVVGFIALLHVYIMVLEMFLWDKPAGLRAFGLPKQLATETKVLGANQGLYNGFLAAGLIWGICLGAAGDHIKIFFLGCIIVAGVFGALTASKKIFFIQTVPASIGLLLVLLS